MTADNGIDPIEVISSRTSLSDTQAARAIDALRAGGFVLELRPPPFSRGSKTVWFNGKAYRYDG